MTKGVMLEALINHYTDGNKAKFASMIGVTPQLISNWIKRETFDAEILFEGCPDVSAEWLLTGEGSMLKEDTQIDNTTLSGVNTQLLELCRQLVSNYKQRDEVMGQLVSMVKRIE